MRSLRFHRPSRWRRSRTNTTSTSCCVIRAVVRFRTSPWRRAKASLMPSRSLVFPKVSAFGSGCATAPARRVRRGFTLPNRRRNGSIYGANCAAWRRQISSWLPSCRAEIFACPCCSRKATFSVGKVYERLAYYTEDVSLSMMGSTPKTSQTVEERAPVDATIEAVRGVCRAFGVEPHGLYQADLKCDGDGVPYVTEINIGRFPMTSPQFDRVGQYSQLTLYIELALDPNASLPRGVYDFDPGWVFLRGVDLPLVITRAEKVAELEAMRG